MGTLTQKQVVEFISTLRLGEVQSLISALETALGVEAQMPHPITLPPSEQAKRDEPDEPDEPTSFAVWITGFSGKKVTALRAVRKLTGLGLREARDLVNAAPVAVLEDVDPQTAKAAQDALREAEVDVEIR